ncbi:hypothetical protein [Pseudoxanthomonas daejeonensis]|uniref:Uncharacterized protein n=1 Tax=Pseudoxanthomonas daejeonensis TaxID=266062 RepID=A0ABQ6Z755_9GAMM|nr:hypothetical protein [Pseudoxanthomonas daejeonensis]KAF1694720.1 hypothetical protein CSC65_08470 [Pseudoxanthomonas daejeonensis]
MTQDRYFEHLRGAEDSRNHQLLKTEFRFHMIQDSGPAPDHGACGYDFNLKYARKGAALSSLPWIVRGLECRCAALEQVDLRYMADGSITARVWVGPGSILEEGLRQFIDRMVRNPIGFLLDRTPALVTWAHLIAAKAIEDVERFREVSMQFREILRSEIPLYLPDTCLPCGLAISLISDIDDEELSEAERAAATTTLERLRSGALRTLALTSGD